MKKNNQMKPDNVAKRLWAFFIVLTMCITVQPVVPVKAQEAVQTAARTIYTEFKDGFYPFWRWKLWKSLQFI